MGESPFVATLGGVDTRSRLTRPTIIVDIALFPSWQVATALTCRMVLGNKGEEETAGGVTFHAQGKRSASSYSHDLL